MSAPIDAVFDITKVLAFSLCGLAAGAWVLVFACRPVRPAPPQPARVARVRRALPAGGQSRPAPAERRERCPIAECGGVVTRVERPSGFVGECDTCGGRFTYERQGAA